MGKRKIVNAIFKLLMKEKGQGERERVKPKGPSKHDLKVANAVWKKKKK